MATTEDYLLEVCVGSLADARAAATAGADRLELCAATEVGGLTPSLALLDQVLEAVDLPVVAMVRPRVGGFCYSAEEFEVALRDAEFILERPVAGIVFGFLQSDGSVDVGRCREFVKLAGARETVFHRAFDFVPDVALATDQLVDLRVTRLLTSGQAANAMVGAPVIRSIVERTQGRLTVMAGGGIRANNLLPILQQTGCLEIHLGASTVARDHSLQGHSRIEFSGEDYLSGGCYRAVEHEAVQSAAELLRQFEVAATKP